MGRIAALVALVVAAVALILIFSGNGEEYTVTAEFENASQLVEGNEVVIAGQPVGIGEDDRARRRRRRARHLHGRRGLRAAQARHHRDRPLLLAVGHRQPPGPADPARRRRFGAELPGRGEGRRRGDRGRRHDDPGRDRLRGRPRRDLQHPRRAHDPQPQEGDQGLRGLLRRRRRAGQQGLSLPEPLPLDLAAGLRRDQPRRARPRGADRRRLEALRRARRARPRPRAAGRQPEPLPGRARQPEGLALRGGRRVPRLHAPGQHHLRQPARRARRRRPPGRRLEAGRDPPAALLRRVPRRPPPTPCRPCATSTTSSCAPAPPTTSST